MPVIGINLKINDLAQLLKPVILNLYDTCVLLRNWIVLLIPKVEDGNNFGVEVQEHCLQQLKSKLSSRLVVKKVTTSTMCYRQ